MALIGDSSTSKNCPPTCPIAPMKEEEAERERGDPEKCRPSAGLGSAVPCVILNPKSSQTTKLNPDSRPALKVALSINTSVKSFKDVKK